MILRYYSEFNDVFLTKTKVVPLRFSSKCMFSLKIDVQKMYFKNHAFDFEKKCKGTILVLVKKTS